MKMIKGSGQIRKLCYCCHEDEEHSRYIMPTGLLFTRIVNGKLVLVSLSRLYAVYIIAVWKPCKIYKAWTCTRNLAITIC